MSKVTIKSNLGRTLIFFDVFGIEKTTSTIELSYTKKKGGKGFAIVPWSAIEILYIDEQFNTSKNEDHVDQDNAENVIADISET